MDDERLSTLKNIGPQTEKWLHDIGIHTKANLQEIGAVIAWKRLKSVYGNKVTFIGLYALYGALKGLHWQDIPTETKQELKRLALAE